MKFLAIVKKEILHNIKDKKAMFLMTIFPIILILILGTAFSGSFESSGTISKIKVAYKAEQKEELYESFKDFTVDIGKKLNIEFKEVKDNKKAIEDVSDGRYDCYINIKDEKNIQFYSNNIRSFNGNLVKTVMQIFVDKTKLIMQTLKVSPEGMEIVTSDKVVKAVTIENIAQKSGPRAKDYYAITMFTMIILYSTNIGAFSVVAEKMRRTYERIRCTTVTKTQFLFAKVVGSFLVTAFQVSIVYLFSRYVIKTNWGSNPEYILMISASLIFMSVALGIGLSSGINNPAIMAAALNMTIPIFVFFAGGYIPLDVFQSDILNTIAKVSPLKWTNEAIFNIIYNNDLTMVSTAIIINVVIGCAFILLSIINAWRKEVA